jgi:hypothetical protein
MRTENKISPLSFCVNFECPDPVQKQMHGSKLLTGDLAFTKGIEPLRLEPRVYKQASLKV